MDLFKNLIYELKKGIRDLALVTCKTSELKIYKPILKNLDIEYFVVNLEKGKHNLFFGNNSCIEIINNFSSSELNKLTPEEDFILGIMLGYSRNEQYSRLLGNFKTEKLKTVTFC